MPKVPPVLVLEGDGCASYARNMLPDDYRTLDWSELEGRDLAGQQVQLWTQDYPKALKVAADLVAHGAHVAIVDQREDAPQYWDFRRAFIECGGGDRLVDFIRARLQPIKPVTKSKPDRKANGHDVTARVPSEPASALSVWQGLGLNTTGRCEPRTQTPHANLSNVSTIMRAHKQYSGRIWFDDFRGRVMYDTPDRGSLPWTDAHELQLADWIQVTLQIPKVSHQLVGAAALNVAYGNRRNSVVTWLDSLRWDRTERLTCWLSDYLGTPNTAYEQALGSNWLISMVARAYRPGCQADHMPVLEGASGRGKSSAIAIIGGEWYQAISQEFGGKPFLEAIQGQWLVEIPDMAGFGRREHGQIISAITTRSDRYRASYAHNAEDHPRVTIFVATSEDNNYLNDTRGTRRYWPVACSELNLEALRAAREQLFAQAVYAFKAGAHWHEMPQIVTADEQAARQSGDPWLPRIARFVGARPLTNTSYVLSEDIMDALEIPTHNRDRGTQMRVANCLKMLGFGRSKVTRVGLLLERRYYKASD